MTWRIAIPSYRRVNIIGEQTLTALQQGRVDLSLVDVWVSDPRELEQYRLAVPEEVTVRLGVPGLCEQHNLIQRSYPAGTRLVVMDDDVRGVVRLTPGGKLEDVPDLTSELDAAWALATEEGVRLWGVSPTANPFYMSPDPKVGCLFTIGCLFGIEVTDPPIVLSLSEKDDYERTLLHYARDGAVLRLSHLSIRTKPYGTPGGCQTYDRVKASARSARILQENWPDLVRPNPRRAGPYAQILLRNPGRRHAA